jgi:hypothetical protein
LLHATHFIQHLADVLAGVEKGSGLSVEVRLLHGGLWRAKEKTLMEDSEADQVFSHESYYGEIVVARLCEI